MKITSIGRGQESLDEFGVAYEGYVFCVVDHDKVVVSREYYDKQEGGMYWFEEWVQSNLDQAEHMMDFFDISWLDNLSAYSMITRIEKPKTASAPNIAHSMGGIPFPEEIIEHSLKCKDVNVLNRPTRKIVDNIIATQTFTGASTQYIRSNRLKVGRNCACPCGSGLKHKRCCL